MISSGLWKDGWKSLKEAMTYGLPRSTLCIKAEGKFIELGFQSESEASDIKLILNNEYKVAREFDQNLPFSYKQEGSTIEININEGARSIKLLKDCKILSAIQVTRLEKKLNCFSESCTNGK